MRISRLEIFGFKSFLERFVLNFDHRIVGIVGPNGCGKSNIVDALRWGLGETHAKQLRGSVLEDVIFNGSESRRPLGMAEVSITIRPEREWHHHSANGNGNGNGKGNHDVLELDELAQREQEGGLLRLSEAVPGLFDAAEIQLTRRLYRSGESEYFINRVPCRLRDIVDLYRAIGLGSRGLSIVQQGQIGDIISKKPVERRELLEEAAGIAGFRVRIEAAQRKLEQTGLNMSRLSDIILEVEKQVVFLRRQAKRARTRNELKERERQVALDLFAARATEVVDRKERAAEQRKVLEEELAAARHRLGVLSADEERYRAEIEQIDVELSDRRTARERITSILNEHAQRAHQLHLRLKESEGRLNTIEGQLRLIDERKEAAGVEIERRKIAITDARTRLAEVEARQAEASDEREASAESAELMGVIERLTRARGNVREQHTALSRQQMDIAALDAEVRTLRTQLAGVAQRASADAGAEGGARSLFSGLRVPAHLERAVSAALGERARYLVSSSLEAAAQQYRRQQSRSEDQTIGFIADQSVLGERHRQRWSNENRLIDRLEVEQDLRSAAEALIGNVVLAESLEEGIAFVERQSGEYVVAVTADGEVVTPWGFERTNYHEALFALTRRVEEREAELALLRTALVEAQRSLAVREEEVANLEARRAELERLAQERAKDEAAEFAAEAASLRGLVGFEQDRIEELRVELTQLVTRQERLLVEQRQAQAQRTELLEQDAQSKGSEEFDEAALNAERSRIEAEILHFEQQKGELRVQFAEVLQGLDESRRCVSSLSDRYGESSLGVERSDMELSVLFEDLKQRYAEAQMPSAQQLAEVRARATEGVHALVLELQGEADRIRQRLEREGEVDPAAIEQYETEERRLEEMRTQLADLQSASEILERTIRELKEVSRTRFMETFAFVNQKFQELVPRLFGGGSGHLELVNPEDPLTSGVELSVRPPGKRLRSMELLSGGEKALVAVSLLVSMFLYRPSPICVLDEVDAPLDDANLERFLGLIKEIAQETQFLIITHNKQTMAAADKLIGITMQEKGVSTALSVSFIEAEKELERLAANQ